MFKNLEEIRHFVFSTLKCACPPEVFEYVEWTNEITIIEHHQPPLVINQMLNIGHKLLVFILEIPTEITPVDFDPILPRLFHFGKSKRDREGFSRFRLVLMVSHSFEEFNRRLTPTFTYLCGMDDKLHLHLLPPV